MPIVAKAGGTKFTPAPEGPQQAVCVDVVDLGLVQQTWTEAQEYKPMVRVIWHSEEIDPETKKPYVIEKRYTLSLHENANLRKDLEAWRGRGFTDAELEGFDLETLIGINAFCSITHNVSKGKTYANVTSIMRLPKGTDALPITPGYIRQCDREGYTAPNARPPVNDAPPPDDDSDVPF